MMKDNIILIGPMGCGKSTIGRNLAKILNKSFYDSDQEIENRTGADLAWIFDIEGDSGFRKREQAIISELTKKQNIVLATGGGVVFLEENRKNLASSGTIVYLKVSIEEQYERMRLDKKRPLLRTDDLLGTLKNLQAEREPYYEELADHIFMTDRKSVPFVVKHIAKYLDLK